MKPEIVELRQAVNMVRILLEHGAEFTGAEQEEIGACAGTLRAHLDIWRKRMAREEGGGRAGPRRGGRAEE